mmetsp:Transcript_82248/g.232940  ORF Transcript_82248/g.232940 Transcript_82248/m.232940 type:complete len:245 (-) Transcript_82248:133-867(-)
MVHVLAAPGEHLHERVAAAVHDPAAERQDHVHRRGAEREEPVAEELGKLVEAKVLDRVQQHHLLALHIGCWGEGHEDADLRGQRVVRRQRREGLRAALRMAHVGQPRGARGIEYVLDLGREVILGHLCPGEIPERRGKGRELCVHPAVLVTPVVAEPHVVARVSEDVGQRLAREVRHEGQGRVPEAVLQQHRRLPAAWLRARARGLVPAARDPEDPQDVAIGCAHAVPLDGVAAAPDELLHLDT